MRRRKTPRTKATMTTLIFDVTNLVIGCIKGKRGEDFDSNAEDKDDEDNNDDKDNEHNDNKNNNDARASISRCHQAGQHKAC